ncbi:MAG: hypothetical protein U9R47_06260 [Actinomycetota bacterium]|nr:hypothetical protein [Actinomycetota bacterium]
MTPESQRLHAALVAAFPAYLTGLFVERGYRLDRAAAEAIETATASLDADLAIELDQPFTEQRRSPLEVFRRALQLPTRALIDSGIAAPGGATPLNESDPFDLSPGSSSALGPEAHTAHLAWGVAKAAAFIGDRSPSVAVPAILVMASSRAESDRLVDRLGSRGVPCIVARNPAAVAVAIAEAAITVAVVDLGHRSSRDAITRCVGAGVPTVVYGDDVDDLTETGLLAQGVRSVVKRREFVADPTRFVPRIV